MGRQDAPPRPLVRIEDAHLVAEGGTARMVVSRLPEPEAVADAVASAGGGARLVDGRLRVVSTPSRLADAAGRAGGADLARQVQGAVTAAVESWQAPTPDLETPAGRLPCSAHPVIMGVVNVTPDSFSDGGAFYDPETHPEPAVEHGRRLAEQGAEILDVGGESTRPGADPAPEEEELRRVLPVVEALAGEGHRVSVDTSKAAVARRCVQAGACLVNDVSAGSLDPDMLPTVAELGAAYLAMHMRGTPRTMQRDPRYDDVVAEVFDFLAEAVERLEAAGVPRSRVAVDPGIGFGKTVEHNLALLRRLREFTSLGRPVLIGASRKSFIGAVCGVEDPDQRLVGSLVAAAHAVACRAAVLRVHDVAETVQAARMAHALATGEWGRAGTTGDG